MPIERIAAFIRGHSGDSFEELALEACRFEYRRSAAFRDLCDRHGAKPEQVSDWRQVPTMPVSALEGPAPSEGEPTEDGLYAEMRRTVVDQTFPAACLAGMARPPMLSLLPEDPADRGQGSTADHVLGAWAAPDTLVAVAAHGGVELAKARSFLAGRQRDRRPTLILANTRTLEQLLGALERRGLRFRLPPGSRVVEAGAREAGSRELLSRLADLLAVPAEEVIREYGVSGLTSRFHAGHSRRGEPRPFRPPPWARVRILDRQTLAEAPPGTPGLISVFDLAGLGSAIHLLTGDLGVAGEDGFRLAGGASPASA